MKGFIIKLKKGDTFTWKFNGVVVKSFPATSR